MTRRRWNTRVWRIALVGAALWLVGCGSPRYRWEFQRGLLQADRPMDEGDYEGARSAYSALTLTARRHDMLRYLQLRLALLEEKQGHVEEALAAYQRIVERPLGPYDDDAGEALYRMGLLQRDTVLDAAAARRSFDLVLRMFPNTAWAPDALEVRVEELRTHASSAQAVAYCDGWYRELRNTEVADELLFRAARMVDDDLGDCPSAIERYAYLEGWYPRSSYTDDAAWRTALCYRKMGQLDREYQRLSDLFELREISWVMADYESKYYVPALLRMAEIRESQDRIPEAVEVLERFGNTYPLSLRIDEVTAHLVELQLRLGRTDDARAWVGWLQRNKPDSRHTARAVALLQEGAR